METYIIRIFRRSEDNPEEIIGTSEHIETGVKQGFQDLDKLCGIIIRSDPAVPVDHQADNAVNQQKNIKVVPVHE